MDGNPSVLHRLRKIAVIPAAAVVLAIAALGLSDATGVTSISDGTGVTSIEIPGMGWVVAEEGTPQADIDAAVENAKYGDWLTHEEAKEEARRDAAFTPPPIDPFDDEGPAADLAAIKAAAPTLLNRELAAQATGVATDERVRLTREIYAAAVVEARIRSLMRALKLQESDDFGPSEFTDHQVLVDKWLGVKADDDQGVALFEGRQRLLWKGEWSERRYRWRLDLVREGGTWKMTRLVFDDLEI